MNLILKVAQFITVAALTPLVTNAAMPKSEILLAHLNTPHGLKVSRITEADSYTNQPLLTEKGIYFTKEVIADEQSQTDIAFYDFATKQTTNLTNSEVSEYSPTLSPIGEGLSAIVVENNTKQKLWYYPFDKSASPKRIFEWIEPVGYHAWGVNDDLVMFILGEPHTLQYTSVASAKPEVVANNIGRTLLFNNASNQYLFSYQKEQQNWLASFKPQSDEVTELFRLPPSLQDFILINDHTLVYALQNRVYKRSLIKPDEVSLWLDLTPYCDTTITRMSYFSEQLAFVCKK